MAELRRGVDNVKRYLVQDGRVVRALEPGEVAPVGRVLRSVRSVRPGARASVLSDSFPDQTFDGWVGFISPVAEFTPKAVETTELRTKLEAALPVLAQRLGQFEGASHLLETHLV